MPETDTAPRICDYEGSDYRTRFWEDKDRDYEDIVERRILRRLLPTGGKRLLEVGAGFGRLTREYDAYEQVVLLDYSFSQLQYAREQLGDDRFVYVAANAYQLPFQPGTFDGATIIRVLHHMADVPTIFRQIRRILAPGGTFILEYANKHNFKAMLRYMLRRQEWSPFDRAPVEFVELNFDFHPEYIARELQGADFQTGQRIPVSFFRIGGLKRVVPVNTLVSLDSAMQRTGMLVSPSIFTRNKAGSDGLDNLDLTGDALFACPETGGNLQREGDALVNESGRRWEIRDGIYVFKQLE